MEDLKEKAKEYFFTEHPRPHSDEKHIAYTVAPNRFIELMSGFAKDATNELKEENEKLREGIRKALLDIEPDGHSQDYDKLHLVSKTLEQLLKNK